MTGVFAVCVADARVQRVRKYEFSSTGESGMGDSWGALTVPYLLAKYVFPAMQHVGWVGLREAELLEKARPFSLELRANWGRLKVANVREGMGNSRSLKKDRWCDGLFFARRTCAWRSSCA
jgi:hypothetical protein